MWLCTVVCARFYFPKDFFPINIKYLWLFCFFVVTLYSLFSPKNLGICWVWKNIQHCSLYHLRRTSSSVFRARLTIRLTRLQPRVLSLGGAKLWNTSDMLLSEFIDSNTDSEFPADRYQCQSQPQKLEPDYFQQFICRTYRILSSGM